MVEGVSEHKHCEVCGKTIGLDVRVCSPECQAQFDEALKMKKRSMWLFIAIIAGLLILVNIRGIGF
jgi:predicted nucleic acid-binding Zn ribbon protein